MGQEVRLAHVLPTCMCVGEGGFWADLPACWPPVMSPLPHPSLGFLGTSDGKALLIPPGYWLWVLLDRWGNK